MKKILILNGHAPFPTAKGLLNKSIIEEMEKGLLEKGNYSILHTNISEGYVVEEEIQKFKDADIIIWQFPLYFTSMPGVAKVYLDNVFTYGGFYTFDAKPLAGKEYMLSVTTGMPGFLFGNKESPYGGKTLDEVLFSVHSAMQAVGLGMLKTFSVHGISPELDINTVKIDVKKHITEVFN